MTAKGSEKFQWNLFGDAERICRECKRKLVVDDVGEERHEFPSQRYTFLCKLCQRAKVDAMIAETRRSLGMGGVAG